MFVALFFYMVIYYFIADLIIQSKYLNGDNSSISVRKVKSITFVLLNSNGYKLLNLLEASMEIY